MINNTYLFVDGSNLYGSQYELFGPQKYLNFKKFIKILEKELNLSFNKIYFYASYSPKPKKISRKAKLYLKNEAFFYKSVNRVKDVVFFKGYRSKTSGKEKEVDVKLTADLVQFGFENKYNKIFLLTGDADFLQALFSISKLKKDIQIISIENQIMYKGAFYFRTSVIDFIPNHLKLNIHPKQKIKVVQIKKEAVEELL